MLASGLSQAEVSRRSGVSKKTVERMSLGQRGHEDCPSLIERFRDNTPDDVSEEPENVFEVLHEELSPRAVKRLRQHMSDAEAGLIPLKAELELLREIFDRGGYPRQQKVVQESRSLQLTGSLEAIIEAGKALKQHGANVLSLDFSGFGRKLKELTADEAVAVEG